MDIELVHCAAKDCGNRLVERLDVTFFKFPENEKLAKIWTKQSSIKSYNYGSTLCSEHFESKYFDTAYKKSVFKTDTIPIPTIFNNIETNTNIFDYNAIGNQGSVVIPPLKIKIYRAEYCRLCAKLFQSNNLVPIFGSSNFIQMLHLCLPGKIEEADELSHLICSTCAHNLTTCYKILKCFKETDSKLQNYWDHYKENILKVNNTHENLDVSNLNEFEIDNVYKVETVQVRYELNTVDNTDEVDTVDYTDELETVDCVEKNEAEECTKDYETSNIENNINEPKVISPVNEPQEISNNLLTSEIINEKFKIELQCIICPAIFHCKEEIMLHAFHKHPSLRGRKIISKIIKSNTQDNIPKKNNALQYQCVICLKTFDIKEDIISHTKMKHKQFLQNIIPIKVNNVQNSKSVCINTELPIKYMCISCPRVFNTKLEIMYHSSQCHPENKITSKIILMRNNLSSLNASLHQKFTNKINLIPKSLMLNQNTEKNSNSKVKPECLSMTNLFNVNKSMEKYKNIIASYKQTYKVKYQCQECSVLFNSYREVLEHSKNIHFIVEEITRNIITVKHNQQVLENKENNIANAIIPIVDGTLEEVDPNMKIETFVSKQPKEIIETRYKCMKCMKIFFSKKFLIKHALSLHPTPGLNEINCKVVRVKLKKNLWVYDSSRRSVYECLICATHHKTKFGLLVHTRRLHPLTNTNKFLCRVISWKNKEPLQCLHCNTIPASYFLYRKHMKQHVSYPCEECNLEFRYKKDLKSHLNIHNLGLKKQHTELKNCIVCQKEFSNRKNLIEHEKVHKISKDVQCSKCYKRYESEYDLKKHERQHVICLCDICGKTYEVGYLKNHLQTHNTDCPFKCKICSQEFKTSNALFKHRRRHNTPYSKAICQICGKVLQRRSLFLHMKIHSEEKSEICDICGTAFRRKDHLRIHKATHTNDVVKTYDCPVCKLLLTNKKSYITHLSDQHGIKCEAKKFSCHLCEKQFNQRANFEDHLRMHSGERNYLCNVCTSAFATERSLKQHSLTHLEYDQLPFKCDLCDKKFRRSSQLKNHRRTHTGEKPFPCPICLRPFRICGDMVKHMKIHTQKEEMYKQPKIEIKTEYDDDEDIYCVINDINEETNKDMPILE